MKEHRKNLVIVRAGEDSLHESWLPPSNTERHWDMLVSSFCDPQKWQRDEVINIHYVGGSKDGLFNAFQQHPELLEQYEYFLIADDDFLIKPEDINRLFDYMRQFNLQLAQPSWDEHSYLTYMENLHNPLFKMRYTNFCEMNTVGIHRKVLKQILPLWEDNPIAWFLDFFWANLTDDPSTQVAVIDDIQVSHSKPYNSGSIYNQGWSHEGPHRYAVLKTSKGIDRKNPDEWEMKEIVTHRAILKNGKLVKGRFRLFPKLLRGWLKMARKVKRQQILENRSIHKTMRRSIKHQLTGSLMLENTRLFIHGRR